MTRISVNPELRQADGRWPEPSAVLELLKPVTWFPPMWAFSCGAIAAGVSFEGRLSTFALGIAITGPLVCASSQAVNDWYDRDVDAINEPKRPIPSGRIPGNWGLRIAIGWTLLSMLAALPLGRLGVAAVAVALLFAWGYSAPPVRFKQNGWVGNATVGLTYEGLAWITGTVVMLGGLLPNARTITIALLYSLGAHGIMTLNDFKSIEGDRQMGIASLPALHGPDRAAWILSLVMLIPQFVVIALLGLWGAPVHATAIAVLIVIQALMMANFVQAPVKRALFLSAAGVPFYVWGMMIAAFALRGIA